MATPVIMPKFEMAQETGKVLRWVKEEGDHVEKGEAILEVETDKVNMDVEAPASGTLVGVQAQAGDVVPVTETIAHILEPGESWPEAPPERATPVARGMAEAEGVELSQVRGTGPGGQVTKSDVEAYLTRREDAPAPSPVEGKVRAVPSARRLARKMGVDLTTVSGTGPDGRIQSVDVQRAAEAAAPEREGRPAVRRAVPFTGMRRSIAERMARSTREAPQFEVSADVEMARAIAVVEDLQTQLAAEDGPHATLTAFLVKACAWALARNPAVNASLEENQIVEWIEVNVGVAVAVEAGLVVPVIHSANALGMEEIATRLNDLTTRARDGELRPEDVQGGTFTLSNLGMFSVDRFTAIVNPTEAAILAVGRVSKRAVATEDNQVEVRPMASLTLTADHRVLDGAVAARFLGDLQTAIEHPGVLM